MVSYHDVANMVGGELNSASEFSSVSTTGGGTFAASTTQKYQVNGHGGARSIRATGNGGTANGTLKSFLGYGLAGLTTPSNTGATRSAWGTGLAGQSDAYNHYDLCVTFRLYINANTGAVAIAFLTNTNGLDICRLTLLADNTLQLRYGDAAGVYATNIVATSSALSNGTWYKVCIRAKKPDSVLGDAELELRLDDARVGSIAYPAQLTPAPGKVDSVKFGNITNSATFDAFYDDIVISDCDFATAGDFYNGFVVSAVPTATTGSGFTAGTGNTFAEVDEIPHDSDTTYLKATAAGNKQLTGAISYTDLPRFSHSQITVIARDEGTSVSGDFVLLTFYYTNGGIGSLQAQAIVLTTSYLTYGNASLLFDPTITEPDTTNGTFGYIGLVSNSAHPVRVTAAYISMFAVYPTTITLTAALNAAATVPTPKLALTSAFANLVMNATAKLGYPDYALYIAGTEPTIRAALQASATVAAILNQNALMRAALSTAATVTAPLVATWKVVAALNAVATVTAPLAKEKQLAATLNAVASVTAPLVKSLELVASIAVTANVAAVLSQAIHNLAKQRPPGGYAEKPSRPPGGLAAWQERPSGGYAGAQRRPDGGIA